MAKAKKAAAKKAAPKKAAKKTTKPAAPAKLKPITGVLSRTELTRTVAEHSGVEAKSVKSVLASLEAAMLASVAKKGAGQFVLPGLLKVTAQAVPAKPKRQGKDPFTGEMRWFAAKPASVRIKARALKKLKDAAL